MEIKDKELHRIATTTLVYKVNDGKDGFVYLITKRALHKKVHAGKWTVPGGGLSVDDYINEKPSTADGKQWYGAVENALRREIKEEVNLEIGKPEFLVDLTFIRPDGIPVLVLSYFAQYISGEVVLDVDATEFAWVTLEEAKNYDLIDGIWDELRQIDEILKNRM